MLMLESTYASKQNDLKHSDVKPMQRKNERCFQGSVKYSRVDKTVWNYNTMPLPVILDPLECKNLFRHLNGKNDKILNNLNYNKTFTLLEDHYFQEQLERFQTPSFFYKLNTM